MKQFLKYGLTFIGGGLAFATLLAYNMVNADRFCNDEDVVCENDKVKVIQLTHGDENVYLATVIHKNISNNFEA